MRIKLASQATWNLGHWVDGENGKIPKEKFYILQAAHWVWTEAMRSSPETSLPVSARRLITGASLKSAVTSWHYWLYQLPAGCTFCKMWAGAKEIEVRKLAMQKCPPRSQNPGSPPDKAVAVKSLPRGQPAISAQVNSQNELRVQFSELTSCIYTLVGH